MNEYSAGNQPQSGNGYYYPQQNNMDGMVPQPKRNNGLIIAVCMAVVAISMVVIMVAFNLSRKEQSSSNEQEASKTKNITCSLTRDVSGYGPVVTTESVTFDASGSKPLAVSETISFSVDSSEKEYLVSSFASESKAFCDESQNIAGITCNYKEDTRSFYWTMEIDLTMLDGVDVANLSPTTQKFLNYTYDSYKSEVESKGATCQ